MNLWLLIGAFLLVSGQARAETEISAPETGAERQETTSDQEWEAKGVIPRGGLTVSTQPMTPIALVPEKPPHDQALEELAIAQDLWKSGKAEAASDVALQAYDDLMGIYPSKRDKTKRQQLQLERRQAATVYINSSIAYIQAFVKRAGDTSVAFIAGRARLGDLRDVSTNYPELTKKVNEAMAAYTESVPSVIISTPAVVSSTAAAAPSTTTLTPN